MAGMVRRQPVSAPRIFSFGDLEQQGREIVAQAQAEAAELLKSARRQAAQLAEEQAQAARAEAHRQGLAAGREEGLKEIRATAHAQAANLVGVLTAMLAEFDQNKRRLIAAAESGLIELALAIARRVCKLEAGASSAAAVANARSLLERVQHHGDAELRVHPAEADAIRTMTAELASAVEQLGHVQIVPDEGIARGGCVLAMREGEVDAALETQLERIAAALRTEGGPLK